MAHYKHLDDKYRTALRRDIRINKQIRYSEMEKHRSEHAERFFNIPPYGKERKSDG